MMPGFLDLLQMQTALNRFVPTHFWMSPRAR
jgi:hypothetical protein